MWALRRSSNRLKNQGFSIGTLQACHAKSEMLSTYYKDMTGICKSPQVINDCHLSSRKFYHPTDIYSVFSMGSCSFSSQAGAKSSGEEDDLEDGFSELEASGNAGGFQDSDAESEHEDELLSDPKSDDDEIESTQNELEPLDTDTDVSEKRSPRKRVSSELFKAIMAASDQPIHSVLNKWDQEGKDMSRAEIAQTMLNLRKIRMFLKALQFSEWMEEHKKLDMVERDYASRVDLIAKVRGLQKAEHYIEKIPKSFRGELVYRTLLANCVSTTNAKKAEEVFNKMKDLGFPITTFACNQLLLLYKRVDKKKIADVLLLMEKENVKPSLFTYGLLIDTKGQSNDITGMEQIVETMKAEGIEPNLQVQSILVRHYVFGGLKEKAEAILKEMEGGNLKENRWVCRVLLPPYAALGKADDVERIWKVCESNPRLPEFVAAIEAYGKLKKVEEAEAIFNKMSKTFKRLSSKHYSALLKVYADHKMLIKGKDLVKQMSDSGCRIGPLTWDALVKLYVEAGEVEKADKILQKAMQQSPIKPMFSTYMAIMDQYAKRGDIHNSEKMFHQMRQSGYVSRLRQFQCLIQAYVNAKAPAYGIKERMKADNIFPNRVVAGQLAQVDAFRKSAVSDLLD